MAEAFRTRIAELEQEILNGNIVVDTAYGLSDSEIKGKIEAVSP